MEQGLSWRCRDRTLRLGARPLVMGILNVTPDSFSDGGRYQTIEAAVQRGLAMADEGADVVDIGGESTRPGAIAVSAADEGARVEPVIRALAKAFSGRPAAPLISVDTRKAMVAERALEAGARIINDITALAGDPGMPALARRYGAGVVLMHMRGEPATMQQDPRYGDVVGEVVDWLAARMTALANDGLDGETIALDPGIGFGKTMEHNVQLIAGLRALTVAGRPVVAGVSRKSFVGKITGRDGDARMAGSLAAAVWAAACGAHVWRVHDVRESVDAARMVAALREETAEWIG